MKRSWPVSMKQYTPLPPNTNSCDGFPGNRRDGWIEITWSPKFTVQSAWEHTWHRTKFKCDYIYTIYMFTMYIIYNAYEHVYTSPCIYMYIILLCVHVANIRPEMCVCCNVSWAGNVQTVSPPTTILFPVFSRLPTVPLPDEAIDRDWYLQSYTHMYHYTVCVLT